MINQQRVANAYSTVQMETRLGGETNGVELVILVLEGVLERLDRARQAMERGEVQERVALIDKLLELISEGLRAHLDMKAGGELAQQLDELYGYCSVRLIEANAKKDPKLLDEVRGLLAPLLSAWRELRAGAAGGDGRTVTPSVALSIAAVGVPRQPAPTTSNSVTNRYASAYTKG